MDLRDTIAAISTPPGRGGLGIVRVSGSAARRIAEAILHFPGPGSWQSWGCRYAELPGPDGAVVDQVVVNFFEGPRSYTAEDVVEIACHGAPVILRYCLERAVECGARLAEPGEFTLRAYLNGRIDLPQAEAVRELIEATTLYQARVAAQQAAGALSRRIAPIKEQLLELIALLEAGIDFAEDDVSVASAQAILGRLEPVEAGLQHLAASFAYGRLVFEGFTLAIVGRPNVGKSSLFNQLLQQDRAIVTEVPGTTRDSVSETISLRGLPVKLIDTAGIRETGDVVESLGVERSFQAMADADVTLVVVDLSSPLTAEDELLLERAASGGRSLVAGNKADLPVRARPNVPHFAVSARTGEGVEELREHIVRSMAPDESIERESGFLTSLRHERLIRRAIEALIPAHAAVEENVPHEMLLLDLYGALESLDALTGATTADDILNRIFSTFCIGK